MAKKFGARQQNKYKIVSSAPSVNKTPMGNSVVPVPYPVNQTYDAADAVSKDVKFNGCGVFTESSHSSKVTGDERGSVGGVVSGTVSEKSEPVEFSPSVKVNGKFVIREGDLHKMQGGNTVGKLVCQESGSTSKISDDGKIEGETLPPDLDLSSASSTTESGAMPSLSAASSTKPTASAASGGLGSRSGSPVILQTAQLIHTEHQAVFSGKPALELSHTYLSRDAFSGIFGNHRRFVYEQTFERQSADTYRLFLSDGRKFDFTESEAGFVDEGDLGALVRRVDAQTFVLEFFDNRRETYRDGRLVSVEDANANAISLHYGVRGRLLTLGSSSGMHLNFGYNRSGRVERISDDTHRIWRYVYDEHANLVECLDPMGGSIRYTYKPFAEADFLLTRVSDNGVQTLAASYDADGRVAGYEEAGRAYTYAYTTPTMITKTETSSGEATHYGLDAHGLVFAIVHSDGSREKEDYDGETRTAVVTDRGGNVTSKTFDERHRLLKEVDQSGNETRYEYEGKNPHPVKVVAPEGERVFEYDTRGNVVRVVQGEERLFAFEYDERGNLLKSTDAAGNETRFEYDDASRLVALTDALGATTRYAYDRSGRQSAATDAEGRKTTLSYDACDRLVGSLDAEGGVLGFAYDRGGNLLGITDASGNETRYGYDALGNIASQRRSDGRVRSFEYLPGGLVRRIVREDGSEVALEYDTNGNPVSIDYAGERVRFAYDSMGNLTEATDASGTVAYHYDAHAHPVTETQRGIDVDRRYDKATGKQEALSFLGRSVSYERDGNGRLAALKTPAQTIAFSRDKSGLLAERGYPNATKETFAYDEGYNLTALETADRSFAYAHDQTGLLTEKNGESFVYDRSGRLTQSPREAFEYDHAGNVVGEHNRYDTLNYRLMENETHSFGYDARGNLTSKRHKRTNETTRYTFDNLDRLVEVLTSDSEGNPLKHFVFAYDALGRRISKTEDGLTMRYLYDRANIVAILDEENEVLATIIHDEGTDQPLSITVHDKPEDPEAFNALSEDEQFIAELQLQRTYWYHRDHQGSIVALTDKNGEIVESFIYDDAYGKILDHHKTEETFNPYGYTAREYDAPDLYYYRARYYDPNTARFLSEDPIEFLSGDFNFYRYVGNDPVNFIDPLGLAASKCAKLEKKLDDITNALKKKLTKLNALKEMAAKKAAKKVATLPLKAVPFLGWAMAAYDVYDTVTTGIDIYDMVKEYNAAADDVARAAAEVDLCKKKEAESKQQNGTNVAEKPYSNPKNRPKYEEGQVDEVWEQSKSKDGKVYDPNTGEEITWDKTQSRSGQWDMGHKPGNEYRDLHQDYMDGKITKDEFLKEYRDPNNYQVESVSANRSHKFENGRSR